MPVCFGDPRYYELQAKLASGEAYISASGAVVEKDKTVSGFDRANAVHVWDGEDWVEQESPVVQFHPDQRFLEEENQSLKKENEALKGRLVKLTEKQASTLFIDLVTLQNPDSMVVKLAEEPETAENAYDRAMKVIE